MNTLVRNFLHLNSARGRLLRKFSKKLGLVYFGSVDQLTDDHDIIRGLTVSTTHKDAHYAVGSYDGYDISIVDRYDTVLSSDGSKTEQTWLIMRIDLQTDELLPHIFLHPLSHAEKAYDRFFTAFHRLVPVNSMLSDAHTPEFHARYELYAPSTQVADIEAYLTPDVSRMIATRLWPHAVELINQRLYIYTADKTLTDTTLNTALESGLWLARIFDRQQD